jgi:hypothetical protein
MSAYEFSGHRPVVEVKGAAFAARTLRAARRRAAAAHAASVNRPSPENLDRAAELEAGLARMEQDLGAVAV